MRLKAAVTDVLASTVTLQAPVPEQAPDQPANVEPAAAAALSVMDVPVATETEHVEPQEMAPPETVPEPAPDLATVRVYNGVPPSC